MRLTSPPTLDRRHRAQRSAMGPRFARRADQTSTTAQGYPLCQRSSRRAVPGSIRAWWTSTQQRGATKSTHAACTGISRAEILRTPWRWTYYPLGQAPRRPHRRSYVVMEKKPSGRNGGLFHVSAQVRAHLSRDPTWGTTYSVRGALRHLLQIGGRSWRLAPHLSASAVTQACIPLRHSSTGRHLDQSETSNRSARGEVPCANRRRSLRCTTLRPTTRTCALAPPSCTAKRAHRGSELRRRDGEDGRARADLRPRSGSARVRPRPSVHAERGTRSLLAASPWSRALHLPQTQCACRQ